MYGQGRLQVACPFLFDQLDRSYWTYSPEDFLENESSLESLRSLTFLSSRWRMYRMSAHFSDPNSFVWSLLVFKSMVVSWHCTLKVLYVFESYINRIFWSHLWKVRGESVTSTKTHLIGNRWRDVFLGRGQTTHDSEAWQLKNSKKGASICKVKPILEFERDMRPEQCLG
jgi:hypothetical protein